MHDTDDTLALALSDFTDGSSVAIQIEAMRRICDLLNEESVIARKAELQTILAKQKLTTTRICRAIDAVAAMGNSLNLLTLVRHFGYALGEERFWLRSFDYAIALKQRETIVVDAQALLEGENSSPRLAYKIVTSLRRSHGDMEVENTPVFRAAVERFHELAKGGPEATFWTARFYREFGQIAVAIETFWSAYRSLPEENPLKAVALREGAELAVSADRWGRDAYILFEARKQGVTVSQSQRFAAILDALDAGGGGDLAESRLFLPETDIQSEILACLETPEIAFDHLLAELKTRQSGYDPQNCLLMVGTSLAGGGMERIFANSYRAAQDSGKFDRVKMALLDFSPGPRAFYLPESGANAEDIAVLETDVPQEHPIALLPGALGRRVQAAYDLIREERPRIIHAWNDLPGVASAFAGLLAGCPKIFIHFHHMRAINLSDDRNLVRSYPYCYRRLLERSEIQLIFVADACAIDYADWWSVPRSETFNVLYNGFLPLPEESRDAESIREALGLPPKRPIIGTVFRFDAVKRPELWISAASRIAETRPDVEFLMVGDGSLWDQSREMIDRLGLSGRFHMPGQVRNVPDYLRCMDIFVLTSSSEGLPNSLVEAQFAGVPVVTTNVGGARETFRDGITGRLTEGDAPHDVAATVLRCLDDRPWLKNAAACAADFARNTFSINAYVDRLLGLYDPGLAPSRPTQTQGTDH
jgi:glycosyltransferase involved in cell wall biosynthesis